MDKSNLGIIIKNARNQKGFTLEHLSASVGISIGYLSGIENEKKIPKLPVLYRLVRALEIPTDLIFYPDKQETSMKMQIMQTLNHCDEQDLERVLELLK